MIKLVLPVCEKQAALVSRLVNRFKQFNDMKDREILVTYCWADHFAVPDLKAFLQPLFKRVLLAQLPDLPEFAEWPEIGNHMFYHSAVALASSDNKDPWYFFETDNWPLYPNWLQDFDIDYAAGGKPYMGVLNQTRFVNQQTGESTERGKHMVGTGVYPADFLDRSREVHTLLYESWDIACQDEIVPECHETQLIFHAWNTGNYHKTSDGQVIGQDFGKQKFRYGGRPIPRAVRIVHGCKDDSLSKIDFQSLGVTV